MSKTSKTKPDEMKKSAVKLGQVIDIISGAPFKSELFNEEGKGLPLMSSEHYEALLKIAKPVREKGRVDKVVVTKVLIQLCSDRYLELRTLANLTKTDHLCICVIHQ
jgi:hypothetical protein